MSSLRAILTAAALAVICGLFVHLASRTPAPVPASAPQTEFSAERAMTHLRAIAARPHPSGSPEHARVRQYLVDSLTALGLEPQVQETTGLGTRVAVAAHVSNVLARVPGREAGGRAVLLLAHYDGVAAGPAAGDDAAGVAAILETVRALRAGPPLAHDVIALFTDAEEAGLVGAAAFTREHPWAKDVSVVLNFEGRGTTGPSLMFETGRGNLDVVRVLAGVPGVSANSLSVTVYRLLPNDTDLSELALLEQPALNFSFIDGVSRYHTAHDDAAVLDAGSLQSHGGQALALARAFGDGQLPRPATGDAVFYTVPALGLVRYPEWLAKPLAVGAAALVLIAGVIVRRRDPRWLRGVALGATATLIVAAVAAAMAYVAAGGLERAAGVVTQTGWKGPRATYGWAIVLLASSIAAGGWAIVRRWGAMPAAHVGALVVWCILAGVVTWLLPGASFLFLWPLAIVTAAAILMQIFRPGPIATITIWLATVAAASVIVPVIYTLALVVFAMTGPAPLILALFVALTSWLLAPLLDVITMTPARRWAMPLSLFAAALVCVVVTMATAGASPSTPLASMLAYAVDADAPGAWLLTPEELAPRGSWAATVVGPAAQVVVPRMTTAAGTPPEWLAHAIAGDVRTLAAPAPAVAIAAPDVTLVRESRAGGVRRLELRIVPAPGTQAILFRAPWAGLLGAAVDGKGVDPGRYRRSSRQWTIGFVAPPPAGFQLVLAVSEGQPFELELVARTPGLPAVPGLVIPPRPSGVAPAFSGDQTVVHRRVTF